MIGMMGGPAGVFIGAAIGGVPERLPVPSVTDSNKTRSFDDLRTGKQSAPISRTIETAANHDRLQMPVNGR